MDVGEGWDAWDRCRMDGRRNECEEGKKEGDDGRRQGTRWKGSMATMMTGANMCARCAMLTLFALTYFRMRDGAAWG